MTQAITAHRASLVGAIDERPSIGPSAGEAKRPIVVVLGMPGSGASLCAHMLSLLGVEMADAADSPPQDATGRWERRPLRDLHDRIFALFGHNSDGSADGAALPAAWWADPGVHAIRRSIVSYLRERMPDDSPFGFKDSRIARLLPVWQQVFRQLRLTPKVVLCLRDPAQIAQFAPEGIAAETTESRWFAYMAEALDNIHDNAICPIEYEDWFKDARINLDKLTKFLGLAWNGSRAELDAAVSQIIDPRRHNQAAAAIEARQPLVRSLYRLLRELDEDAAAREAALQIVDQYSAYRKLCLPPDDAVARLADLERQLAALRSERDAAVAERDRTTAAARETAPAGHGRGGDPSSAPLQNAPAELAAMEADLDRAQRRAGDLEEACEAAQAAIEMLRRSLADSERQAAERMAAAERIAAERDEIRARHELAAGERDRLREELPRIAEERDGLREKCDALALDWQRTADERDRLAADSVRWFDAAILTALERTGRQRSRRRWRIGRFVLQIARTRGRGSPLQRADRARAARQWGRAARYYLEALDQLGDRPAIWVQFGHALGEAGKLAEAEFAFRRAVELDNADADALLALGRILKREARPGEAAAIYRRALERAAFPELRRSIAAELAELDDQADLPPDAEPPEDDAEMPIA